MNKIILIISFTFIFVINCQCNNIDSIHYVLYKKAYEQIVNDTTFLDYNLNVSCKMTGSSYLFLRHSGIIKEKNIKSIKEQVQLHKSLSRRDNINNSNVSALCFPFTDTLNDNNKPTKENKENKDVRFSQIYSRDNCYDLFAEVWIVEGQDFGGIIFGGTYYLYMFIFDEYGNLNKIHNKGLWIDN